MIPGILGCGRRKGKALQEKDAGGDDIAHNNRRPPRPLTRGPSRLPRTSSHRMKSLPPTVAAVLFLFVASAGTGRDTPPAAKRYPDPVGTFLDRHCAECHRTDKPKGNFHLDRLAADFTDKA